MAFYIKEFNMYGSQIQGHKSFRANYPAFDDKLYRPEEVVSWWDLLLMYVWIPMSMQIYNQLQIDEKTKYTCTHSTF